MEIIKSIRIRRELGESLREIREKHKFTQVEVANAAGIDVNYYARIERGVANPSYEKIYSIMEVLKMDALVIK